MKKFITLFMTLVLIFSVNICAFAYEENDTETVIITKSGSCYHIEDCGNFGETIEISKEEAIQRGYKPCEKCFPNGDAKTETITEKEASTEEKKTETQEAITSETEASSKEETSLIITEKEIYTEIESLIPPTGSDLWILICAISLFIVAIIIGLCAKRKDS